MSARSRSLMAAVATRWMTGVERAAGFRILISATAPIVMASASTLSIPRAGKPGVWTLLRMGKLALCYNPRVLGLWTFLLAALLAPAAASDLGGEVTAGGQPLAGRLSAGWFTPAQTKVSDWIAEPFDTVLFQGVCGDPNASFEAARQDASGQWSGWVPARVKRFPGDRYWAKAVFPLAAPGRVKLRASNASGWAAIEVFSLDVFKARGADGGAPRDSLSLPDPRDPVEPGPAPVGPEVLPREAWGAKPPKEPFTPMAPYRFTQHHTAGRLPRTPEESLAEMRFLQDFHQNGRGWNDIGYHFIIDGEGRVYQGRPIDAQGAHVLSNNAGNVGISLMGSYHAPYWHQITPAQLESIKRLGLWLRDRFGVSPDTYRGHRDYKGTTCPGDVVYQHLPGIREALSAAPAPIQAALRSLDLERLPEALRRAFR